MHRDPTHWPELLESDYRQATGLTNRNEYCLPCAPLSPAQVVLLELLPGREPGSRPVHPAMERLLATVLDDPQASGHVTRATLIFRRPPREGRFERRHNMTIDQACAETAPFLKRVLQACNPHLIVLAGPLLPIFVKHYGDARLDPVDDPIITPGREQRTLLYAAYQCHVPAMARTVPVVKLACPTLHGTHYTGNGIVERLRGLRAQRSAGSHAGHGVEPKA